MKLFTLEPVEDSALVLPTNTDDANLFRELDGRPHGAVWNPVEVEIHDTEIDENGGTVPLRQVDCPWMGSHVLVARDSAIALLRTVLQVYGELLPLSCATAEVAVFNPGQVIDALNEERSGIERFDDGRLMFIERYVFRAEAIPDRAAFKTPEEPDGPILFTEPLVEELRRLELSGLDFATVWDSAHS